MTGQKGTSKCVFAITEQALRDERNSSGVLRGLAEISKKHNNKSLFNIDLTNAFLESMSFTFIRLRTQPRVGRERRAGKSERH